VRYDIGYDPAKNRVYLDASWQRPGAPEAPSLDAAVRDGLLAVDTTDSHLAARVLDRHENPVGPAYTLRLDLTGLPASRRDGRVRAAISRLIQLARDAGVKAIAIEDLDFADARATGRETMGRGARGKRFRATVAGIPTARLRDRMAAMVPRAGLTLVAIDPAYTSRWGKRHWLGPARGTAPSNSASTARPARPTRLPVTTPRRW
jgi:hypothetical protein